MVVRWKTDRDSYGMALSQMLMWAIIITTSRSLHTHNITDIQSAGQAAKALASVYLPKTLRIQILSNFSVEGFLDKLLPLWMRFYLISVAISKGD